MNAPVAAGVDIGGTAIKAGLLTADGTVLGKTEINTPQNSTPRAVMDAVMALLRQLCSDAGQSVETLAGLGMGVPGLVDASRNMVRTCVNLKDWHNVPLGELVANRLSPELTVAVANDANATALGEFVALNRENPKIRHMAMITIGTGVGAGIVLDGKMFGGGMGLAGEIGHMIVRANGRQCSCGQYGCLERYASATAMIETAEEMVQRGVETCLTEVVNDPQRNLGARDIFHLAREGDATSQRIVDGMAEFLAIGCVNLCRVVDLQSIVIGGGVTGAGDELLNPLQAAYRVQNWALAEAPTPDLRLSMQGQDAGFIGAGMQIFQPR